MVAMATSCQAVIKQCHALLYFMVIVSINFHGIPLKIVKFITFKPKHSDMVAMAISYPINTKICYTQMHLTVVILKTKCHGNPLKILEAKFF